MVNMFHRNQAALLPIQLLLICHNNFAERQPDEHRNILVSSGDPVMLTCNVPWTNISQINWIKDRFLFAYKFSLNQTQTISNFSSDRVKIDSGFPSTLNIFNAQHDDTGHYRCQVTGRNGTWTATWNLTLSEKPEEIHFNTWYLLYTLTAVTGLLLCGITSAVCLYRKCGNGTPDWGQFHLESGEEMAVHQRQAETHMRRNNKRRSHLMVVMFRRNQAALLSIQLLGVCYVFAGPYQEEHRNILVSTGDPVMLTCNTSWTNISQINWIKDRFLYTYRFSLNRTFSNFSSDRVKIDAGLPSTLNIFNAHHNDTGLYRCEVFGRKGFWNVTWNLTLSEKHEANIDFNIWYLLYTLTTVTGLLLCGITSAVCLYRWLFINHRLKQTLGEIRRRGVSTRKDSIQSTVSTELMRNQAALLSIQLLQCYVFAGHCQGEHRNILASTGDPAMLTCNTSWTNISQISWIKDRFLFTYTFLRNRTFSNFSPDRVKIDSGFPSTLNIFDAQHNDTGLYRCQVTGQKGSWTATWNLTLSEKHEVVVEITDFNIWYLLYTLATVTGLLLCGITSAVCLYRKRRTRTLDQDPVQDQFYLDSEREVAVYQPQAETDIRRNKKKRSQYKERLNSIYGETKQLCSPFNYYCVMSLQGIVKGLIEKSTGTYWCPQETMSC
ncbi:hypothetical protein INR49_021942 [Caranx melampygus]|nr:hypothetical protein INR49_021942 [Caranx melampygus]